MTMFISQEQKKHISETLQENKGDVDKTAKDLGFTPNQIRWADTTYNKNFTVGLGRPEIRGSIVAVRSSKTEGWDNADPAIRKARQMYDEGKVELCTGRDGEQFILYAILRRYIDKLRIPYFTLRYTDAEGQEVAMKEAK